MAKPISHAEAMVNPHDRSVPPSRVPLLLQRGLFAILVVGVAVASSYALTCHWRRATAALGTSLLWLAICRCTCSDSVFGLVSVRSRRFDAAFCIIIGCLMLMLSLSVDTLTA